MSDSPKVAKAGKPQIKSEAIEVIEVSPSAQQSEKEDENVVPSGVEKDPKTETSRHYYRAERLR